MPKRKGERGVFRRTLRWVWIFCSFMVIFSVIQVVSLRFMNPLFTMVTAVERVGSLIGIKAEPPRIRWRPLREISPHIRRAVLAGEDQRFLTHNGFDFIELNKAIKDMVLDKGHRGASTITMQVSRTVFLWPERSWVRKILEAYYTVLIELFWVKARILEVYLNTVDWGDRIMGADAATWAYFKCPPSRVSRQQAAMLAAILPNPHRWSPKNPNARVLMRQKKILRGIEKMPLLP